MRVLVTTIYQGHSVLELAKRFSPAKIYFVEDEPIDSVRKSAINMIRDLFPNVTYPREIKAKIYDIENIARACASAIIKEREHEVIVNVSEGKHTMCYGLLYSAYLLRRYIKSMHHVIEETREIIDLPLFELKTSPKKRQILETLRDGEPSIERLEQELDSKAATLYVQLKELRDDGFISRDNKLTAMGKVLLLAR